MERFFNTAGPVNRKKHYMLPLEARLDVNEILMLIRQEKYFILHAPRQTGKTTALLALMELLNRSGEYRALYVNVESAQAYREKISMAMESITHENVMKADAYLHDPFPAQIAGELVKKGSYNDAVKILLNRWAVESPLPWSSSSMK
jgi:predicted ATP-binding protein involved in virulence